MPAVLAKYFVCSSKSNLDKMEPLQGPRNFLQQGEWGKYFRSNLEVAWNSSVMTDPTDATQRATENNEVLLGHGNTEKLKGSVRSSNKGILETKTNSRNCKAFFKDRKHLDLFLMNLRILQRKQMVGLNKIEVRLARQPFTVAIVHAILLMHHRSMPATQHNSFK